ncbi:MAG TPA: carboxylating nicotinate-nucleotide diphosphorylase [Phycisphaerales bacterium]|nr:carboxylating nicotinate-nucleotide diphosphorylase [Phycisphaerales bacterium]
MADLNALSLPELFGALCGDLGPLVRAMHREDLGPEGVDLTSLATVDEDARLEAVIAAREGGVVCGLAAIPAVLAVFAPGVRFEAAAHDGESVEGGAALARLEGPARELLAAERSLLNLIGRLSGVATRTAAFVRAIGEGARARLYDTRKTTPGLRGPEKYAVRCGGGVCHRIGLHDAVLIKDNHLAGLTARQVGERVREAALRARAMREAGRTVRFVEVEVDSLGQLEAVLGVEAGLVDLVLLDNMPPATLREAVRRRDAAGSRIELEASGGVTLETIREIALTGVERISTGSITHHAVWLDVGMDAA